MTNTGDSALKARAAKVIPGGMYGHQSVKLMPPETPQFFTRAEGAYLWDADGKRYIDFMCGYGPNLFGYGDAEIDAAYAAQMQEIDTATAPAPIMVDLAEAMTGMVAHADWAIFCKNGTDATSMALMVARAQTGKAKVLVAKGAYHGAAAWATPLPAGTTPEDRANLIHFTYNDTASLEAAVAEAGDDLAAIMASPFKHDVVVDQELPDPAYSKRARELCDASGALLIIDDVRGGFRIARECSWAPLGVQPDLSCWGKAIANGHPISALLGSVHTADAAASIYVTGSFWFSAAPMAASLKTLQRIRETDYLEHTIRLGTRLREGLAAIADDAGVALSQTGPVQMPLIMVNGADGKRDLDASSAFAGAMIARGVYFHPFHNMFFNAAMTDADVDFALEAARTAMGALEPV